jgi:hypothetical protein
LTLNPLKVMDGMSLPLSKFYISGLYFPEIDPIQVGNAC